MKLAFDCSTSNLNFKWDSKVLELNGNQECFWNSTSERH
jgi:hypothetical protein